MLTIPKQFPKKKASIVGAAALAVGFFGAVGILGALNKLPSLMAPLF